MSELKQCSKCCRWTNPLPKSACSFDFDVDIKLDFIENEKGDLYCDDFKSNLEKGE